MNILAVSDEIINRLYNPGVRDTFPGVQLIFGCGDLPYSYLDFLVTIYNVPLFYVPGNHDPEFSLQKGHHVEGGTNLDGQVVMTKGLVVAGLGGSVLYGTGSPNQYTQQEMFGRVYQLLPKILIASLQHHRRLDILLTHSPPHGIHDDDDQAHQGLRALNLVLKIAKPRFMLHGHTIFYKNNLKSNVTEYLQTKVVNIYPYRLLDIDNDRS